MSNIFIVKGNNKSSLTRTEKYWFAITYCVILTGGHIDDNDGLYRMLLEYQIDMQQTWLIDQVELGSENPV